MVIWERELTDRALRMARIANFLETGTDDARRDKSVVGNVR